MSKAWFCVTALIVICCLSAAPLVAQADGASTDLVTPDIPGVVKGGTKIQLIKDGFNGTEAPIPAEDGSLLFTEQGASRIVKMDKQGSFSTYVENTDRTIGLGMDAKGRLIGAQSESSKLAVLKPTYSVLADKFEGKPIGHPNDLVIDKKGGIYFTDPVVSLAAPPTKPLPMPPRVFYLKPSGELIEVSQDVPGPNGVMLSPDEKTLYVANTPGEYIIAFDVQADGTLKNKRNFAKLQAKQTDAGMRAGADGLEIDSEGRLYVASTVGVQVVSPKGEYLGTIPFPKIPQNLVFSGPDKKTLYVVGRGSLFQISMLASGYKGRAR